MKRLFYILALAALLPSCKKETWADWRVENEIWIEQISSKSGVITTPTGLRYEVVAQPQTTGQHPDDIKSVVVLYKGSFIGPLDNPTGGRVFDQNTDTTSWMAMSQLISGFSEGLKKMTPHSHYILYIPYNLAYGADGSGTEGGTSFIPPYTTLVFDVTLYNVK